MLIAVTIIITGVIVFSLTFVYVNITEKINNNIIVKASDIPTPLNIFFAFSIFLSSLHIFFILLIYINKKKEIELYNSIS